MGQRDIISKRILKILMRDFATQVFGLPVTRIELLDTQSQRVEERRADLLAKAAVQGQPPFILHIEIQNDNQRGMPARMLRYLSDIALDYPKWPVRQYLVYIGKKPLRMADGLEFPDFHYRYRIMDMRRMDYEVLLARDVPDAWVLAILCDFKGRLPRVVVQRILKQLQTHFGENISGLREYVDMLDILAGNRDLNLDVYEEMKMLTIDVEKLATYRLGMDKGIEKGMEKGAHRQAIEIAKKLLGIGHEPEQVAMLTGLAVDEVEGLARQVAAPNS